MHQFQGSTVQKILITAPNHHQQMHFCKLSAGLCTAMWACLGRIAHQALSCFYHFLVLFVPRGAPSGVFSYLRLLFQIDFKGWLCGLYDGYEGLTFQGGVPTLPRIVICRTPLLNPLSNAYVVSMPISMPYSRGVSFQEGKPFTEYVLFSNTDTSIRYIHLKSIFRFQTYLSHDELRGYLSWVG